MRTIVDVGLPRTPSGTPQAIRVDAFVFTSGQVFFDKDRNLIGEGDAQEQARQCFRNLEAILRAEGGTLEDIVRITC